MSKQDHKASLAFNPVRVTSAEYADVVKYRDNSYQIIAPLRGLQGNHIQAVVRALLHLEKLECPYLGYKAIQTFFEAPYFKSRDVLPVPLFKKRKDLVEFLKRLVKIGAVKNPRQALIWFVEVMFERYVLVQ